MVEFSAGEDPGHQNTFRLILPHGSWRFTLEQLVPDEERPWLERWEPYGRGVHNEVRILRHQLEARLGAGPLPAALLCNLHRVLRYARTGNLASGRGQAEAALA